MEMKINLNKLIDERNNRAWTQAHLAEVCDLSLRTIQRIEKTGSASHESIQALAAVFEISIEELIYKKPKPISLSEKNNKPKGRILARIGLILIMIVPLVVIFTALTGTHIWVNTLSDTGIRGFRTSSSTLMLLMNYTHIALFTLLPGVVLISISKYYYHYSKSWMNKILIVAILLLALANPIIAAIVVIILVTLSLLLKNKLNRITP